MAGSFFIWLGLNGEKGLLKRTHGGALGLYPKEKIGFDSIISICPANRLDTLITDWDASEEDLKQFDEQEIKVVVVDKPEG